MTSPTENALFADAEAAAGVLRMLSNVSRLRIAMALLDTEKSVATLEATLNIKQPNLSQQLGEMRNGGVLKARRSAKSVFYSIADPRVQDIVALLVSALGEKQRGQEAEPGMVAVRHQAQRSRSPGEAAQFAQVWALSDEGKGL